MSRQTLSLLSLFSSQNFSQKFLGDFFHSVRCRAVFVSAFRSCPRSQISHQKASQVLRQTHQVSQQCQFSTTQ
uniref:Uncharacterized protein n=1 Tax=uncultured marine virus TaxID=186617 RepID=A0A0F7L3T5_9VIRU|nr:hypothetical protein [uncultured marine virus]